MGRRKSAERDSIRAAVKLKGNLEKRLAAYALAAGAAGVGVLASAPQAEAQVVFTNTWIPITPGTSTTNIDLNNDGVVDFVLSATNTFRTWSSGEAWRYVVRVVPQAPGNSVWGAVPSASALASGVSVGSKGQFRAGQSFMASAGRGIARSQTLSGSGGPWRQATNLFLGVKFVIQGETHYGWVRVDMDATRRGVYGAISGYAYQSTANAPIKTGQKSGSDSKDGARARKIVGEVVIPSKSSLSQLATGAVGLESRRSVTGTANGGEE
jgi:hypothetical protein